MIIPIKVPKGRGGEDGSSSMEKIEWVMLELNGELVKPQQEAVRNTTEAEQSDKRRVELGSVQFDDAGAPTLIIGNHELKGTSIALKNPFAVLRKRKANQLSGAEDGSDADSKIMKRSGVEYEVAGIVKKKLMFDKYPKSIMR
mmetsp:Transcript_18941/g.38181  ORF Transcript_18941/g.38181 Transcript_18941/m.38181 type:complete len:143 (+) Transcript_18941:58-486(+)